MLPNPLTIKPLIFLLLIYGVVRCELWEITSEFNDNDTFDSAMLSTWKLQNFYGTSVSICNKNNLVGGYGVSSSAKMSKDFTLKAPPKQLHIQFALYFIGQWKTDSDVNTGIIPDSIEIYLNDKQVFSIKNSQNIQESSSDSNEGIKFCGERTTPVSNTYVRLTVPFTEKTFTLSIQGQISNPSAGWWGINKFQLFADQGIPDEALILKELPDVLNFGDANWKIYQQTTSQSSSSKVSKQVMQCGSEKIFRSPSPTTTFTRSIIGLPDHTFILFKLKIFWIDSYDASDSVTFYLDNEIIHEQPKSSSLGTINICGNSNIPDSMQNIEIFVPHTKYNTILKIKVNGKAANSQSSFGFNNFSIATSMPCPILYDEFGEDGKTLQFCGKFPNMKAAGWKKSIKGIYIPNNMRIGLTHTDSDGTNTTLIIEESNYYLSENEINIINESFFGRSIKNKDTQDYSSEDLA